LEAVRDDVSDPAISTLIRALGGVVRGDYSNAEVDRE
jgi:hypothetical protein